MTKPRRVAREERTPNTAAIKVVRVTAPTEATKEEDHVSEVGKERLAERIEEADEVAAREGAEQIPRAAEDEDDERKRQHVHVETGIDREDGPAEDAAHSGERGAGAEHDGEEARNGDAQAARHLHVVDAGAYHRADSRPLEREPEDDAHHDRDDRHRAAVPGEEDSRHRNGAGERLRDGQRHGIAGPDEERGISDDEGDPQGDENLRQRLAREAPEQE